MPPTPVLFFGAIVALIVGFSIYRWMTARERTAALGRLAASLGLTSTRESDQATVRAALTPAVTSYFVAHQGWWIEAQAGSAAIYRENTEATPAEMRQFIADACEAANRL
jgi:hypothetical protein